jgi:hypothetical protein
VVEVDNLTDKQELQILGTVAAALIMEVPVAAQQEVQEL